MAIDLTQIDWEEYNPFKMWGAWIGVGIGILYGIWNLFAAVFSMCWFGSIWYQIIAFPAFIMCQLVERSATFLNCLLITVPIAIIECFLIGWGIHSLVRKLKK